MIERLSRVLAVFALLGGTAWAGSMNGVAGSMPAYYDDTLFTINFMELASSGEAANLAHNESINTIYMCDACEGQLPGWLVRERHRCDLGRRLQPALARGADQLQRGRDAATVHLGQRYPRGRECPADNADADHRGVSLLGDRQAETPAPAGGCAHSEDFSVLS